MYTTDAKTGRTIPKTCLAVRDRKSDAVAYLFETGTGQPAVLAFCGRRRKPDLRFRYSTASERERAVAAYFDSVRGWAEKKAARQAKRSHPHRLELGHILVSSWGYDQTNVDFYEVVRIVGAHTVELARLASSESHTGDMTGTCVPRIGEHEGERMRVRAGPRGVKVGSGRYADIWDGRPCRWSSYA